METIQIELTNACVLKCSNCTRFSGSQYQPFFITEEQFTAAVDSLVEYPKQNPNGIVGFMGGEPMLHPQFEKFCAIALERIPREHLGLWSTFPPAKRKYREVICRTFGQVLLNDHSRGDIMHAPVLVAIEEVFKDKDERFMWSLIDRCWVQNSWSASVTPKGAYFCEVAAAL
jgi:organic radical activating enzyme